MGLFDSLKRYKFHFETGNHKCGLHVRISGNRIGANLERAQEYLDNAVLQDSNLFVPRREGRLRDSGIDHTVIGSGLVQWKTPYAHYQHAGKDMIGIVSKRHWAMKGEPKMYNGKSLRYHTAGTGSYWFDKAKKVHGKQWVKNTKKIAGGR